MSKRFGRNQKRRLVEALKQAEQVNQAITSQMVSVQRQNVRLRSDLQDIHREICEAFNKYHPLMKADIHAQRPDMERMNIATMPRSVVPFNTDPYSVNNVDPVMIHQRVVFLLRIQTWPDEYRNGLTFRATYNGKDVGFYANTLEMIRDDLAIPYMAEHIARDLMRHLRGSKR